MKNKTKFAPHIHSDNTVLSIQADNMIALIPVVVMAFLFYGVRALAFVLVSGICMTVFIKFLSKLVGLKSKNNLLELFSFGAFVALMCSITTSFLIIIIACLISSIIYVLFLILSKIYSFSLLSIRRQLQYHSLFFFSTNMFYYSANIASQAVPLFGKGNYVLAPSFANVLSHNKLPDYTLFETIIGRVAGPIGATCVVVIIAAAVYLIYRKSIAWQATLSFFTFYIIGLFIMILAKGGSLNSLLYELCGGGVIFCGVFLVSSFRGSPKSPLGRVEFGFFIALISILLRACSLQITLPFAIIIMNLFAEKCDTFIFFMRERLNIKYRTK